EGEAITAREARRLAGRAFELVDHLTFSHGDAAERDGKTDFLDEEFDLDIAEADLASERMRAAETALGRVAQRKQKTFVAARKILQANIAISGKGQGLTRKIPDHAVRRTRGGPFDQAIVGKKVRHRPHGRSLVGGRRQLGDVGLAGKTLIK